MDVRVQSNHNEISIFTGNENQIVNGSNKQNMASNKENAGKSIFAGNLNMTTDHIEQKRDMARKKAMRVLEEEFANEKDIDKMVEEQKEKVSEVMEQFQENAQTLKDVKAAKEQYMEEYDLKEDGVVPTAEQMTDLIEFSKAEAELNGRMILAKEEAKARNRAVDEIMIEREKSHGMVDAREEADTILEEAGEEILDMLVEEAKEHVEDTQEEQKEKAEELKEKKEEEQEKVEKKNETPQQEAVSKTSETMGELQDISQDCQMLQKELKVMIETKEITEEDIKGLLADWQL